MVVDAACVDVDVDVIELPEPTPSEEIVVDPSAIPTPAPP